VLDELSLLTLIEGFFFHRRGLLYCGNVKEDDMQIVAHTCGYPPFNGAGNGEVHDAIRRGQYRFPATEWSGRSRESRDFICRLLQKDPWKRMTVGQALSHPWLVKNANTNAMQIKGDRQDHSSVEVVFDEQSQRDSFICGDIPLNRFNGVRTALFGNF